MGTPTCRSCGAETAGQTVRAEHVFGGEGEYKFWQCAGCGLVYLWPVPSEEQEAFFYAKEFEKYMSRRAGADRDWSGAEAHIKTNQDQVVRRWKFLKEYLTAGKSILEIGCSSGFMMDAFKQAKIEVTGIEPSKQFLDYLKQKGHRAFESISQLKKALPDKRYDLIVHFFVLEHIRDTEAFIREQLELLKPEGTIIAEVPCVNDPLTSIYKIPAFERFYWSIAHHYYFNPASLARILDRIGCRYRFVPEQRYDLSNHLVWMSEGRPGGQGRYSQVFSAETLDNYAQDLKNSWHCDTFFVYISNNEGNKQ
jgi:SAM-dependent methyltransferase